MGKDIIIHVNEIGQSFIPMEGIRSSCLQILLALEPTLNYIFKGASEGSLR